MFRQHFAPRCVSAVCASLCVAASRGSAQTLVPIDSGSPPAPRVVGLERRGPLVIDGRLSEADWSLAPVVSEFREVEPVQNAPVQFRTSIRVLWDADNLYVGVVAYDSLGARGVRVQDLRREFDFEQNDYVGVALDGFHDRRNALAFEFTPLGTQRDLQALDGTQINEQWEAAWRVRTQVTDSGWTAEVRIPWQSLRYRTDGGTWGIQVYRLARRGNEVSSISPWPRNLNPFRMDFAATLEGLRPPPPRAAVRVRPYVLGSVLGEDTRRPVADGGVGGEITWAPTGNSLLEGTVRTDFAQADVDRQVVNLSRFSVFFPERRQFFLETANLFSAGVDSDDFQLLPFFSRSIGLTPDGAPVPIDLGARYSLRSSARAAGAMLIRTARTADARATSFGVARYNHNLHSTARVGGLVTARVEDGGTQTGTAAADWLLRLSPSTQWSAMLSSTFGDDTSARGFAATSLLTKDANAGFGYLSNAVATSGYRPSMGFVSRPDVFRTAVGGGADWRPAGLPAWLRKIAPGTNNTIIVSPDGFGLQESNHELYLDVVTQSGAQFSLFGEYNQQRLPSVFEPVNGLSIAPGAYNFGRGGFYTQSDLSARYSIRLLGTTGAYFDGRRHRAQLTLRAAPSPRIALQADYEVNVLRNVGVGDANVTTHLLAPELRVGVTPRMALSAFYQWNSEERSGALNARYTWEFAPLSYVYVVWNDRRRIGDLMPGVMPVTGRRELLVKLVYLWQR
jgi:hypothetical protein